MANTLDLTGYPVFDSFSEDEMRAFRALDDGAAMRVIVAAKDSLQRARDTLTQLRVGTVDVVADPKKETGAGSNPYDPSGWGFFAEWTEAERGAFRELDPERALAVIESGKRDGAAAAKRRMSELLTTGGGAGAGGSTEVVVDRCAQMPMPADCPGYREVDRASGSSSSPAKTGFAATIAKVPWWGWLALGAGAAFILTPRKD